LNAGFKYAETWSLKTENGTVIDKNYFRETSADFDNKALVVSIFLSPCLGATVTRHCLWTQANQLHVEIDYMHGSETAVETVMVIMEVDRNYVANVDEVVLDLN